MSNSKNENDGAPFSVLLGNRIAIRNFITGQGVDKVELIPENKIILTDKDQKEIEQKAVTDALMSTDRFIISQVGTGCDPIFKVGQEIDIENPAYNLHHERAHFIMKDSVITAFIIPERIITGIF